MSDDRPFSGGSVRAFLGALGRDTRANTLAIMAIALIPLAGMVGGGVDISRMYIVKTRLQHACDAGALAGRKTMGGGVWNFNSNFANTQAEKFFDANYNRDAYGVTSVTKAFSENAGKVTGTASAVLPMTLMRIFGKTSETLTVNCDAEMRLPNTDVMFVLDTTGSMDADDGSGKMKKIDGLKVAVKCFYEIVARYDTDATCDGGAPSGGTGSQVQIRFGFVPYATNVNVGRLLKTEWMADNWTYQTRKLKTAASGSWGSWSSSQYIACNSVPDDTESRQYSVENSGWGFCTYRTRTWSGTAAKWDYGALVQPISGLKSGTNWNNSFTLPIGTGGAQKTISWDGCIEERGTVSQASYQPIPSGATDLNIDMVPNSEATRWGPALPDVIFTRKTGARTGGSYDMAAVSNTDAIYSNTSYYACPTPAKKLQPWNASDFDDYVDSLKPEGNTYHDIGLLWGARLLSPTGLFKSENAYTPQGGEIERHLIFMTDGDTCTGVNNYTAYGVSWFDRRTTDKSVAPTEGCTDTGTLTTQVNARYAALCDAVKKSKITLWVVSFGKVAATTEARLKTCATDERYFNTTDSKDLQAKFRSIADQISQLRLTR